MREADHEIYRLFFLAGKNSRVIRRKRQKRVPIPMMKDSVLHQTNVQNVDNQNTPGTVNNEDLFC
ncbi:hypothetical protein D479_02007 [Halobacillus sp. BAB-2008]|nr:hypothetical protein D479_02007 [Halobacillus sp. BAB-2008]